MIRIAPLIARSLMLLHLLPLWADNQITTLLSHQ
jgi:hypothetical protein